MRPERQPWRVPGLDQLPVLPGETLAGRLRVERVLGEPQTDYTRTLLAAVPRIAVPTPG